LARYFTRTDEIALRVDLMFAKEPAFNLRGKLFLPNSWGPNGPVSTCWGSGVLNWGVPCDDSDPIASGSYVRGADDRHGEKVHGITEDFYPWDIAPAAVNRLSDAQWHRITLRLNEKGFGEFWVDGEKVIGVPGGYDTSWWWASDHTMAPGTAIGFAIGGGFAGEVTPHEEFVDDLIVWH
jgi:hypothetical protein